MHHFEAMKSSNVHFTFFRMGKILEGLLAGSVEAEVPHGVECLRDAKHIWERFGGVIDQLKHGSFNSVLHAIEDMGHVIHDVANELEECKATVGTDLDKLREMSKAFTDPWYFIFHVEHDLIVNGQDIHHEIMDAEAQWENQHFYEFGHSVGLALSKIFLGGQMKNGIPVHHRPYGHGYAHADTVYEHGTVHHPVAVGEHESFHYTPGHYANKEKDDNIADYDVTPYEASVEGHQRYGHYDGHYGRHYAAPGHYDNKEDNYLAHHDITPYEASHGAMGLYHGNGEAKKDDVVAVFTEPVHHGDHYRHDTGYDHLGAVVSEHETTVHHDTHHHEAPVHHREYVHDEYHYTEPRHFVERLHEYHHEEPVYHHETIAHHDVTPYEHRVAEHVVDHHTELVHHDTPVVHEYTTLTESHVAPHHTYESVEHEYSPEIAHRYYAEHETAHAVHHEPYLRPYDHEAVVLAPAVHEYTTEHHTPYYNLEESNKNDISVTKFLN